MFLTEILVASTKFSVINILQFYWQGIPRVPKIKANYNPATWMLEITSISAEAELGLDFSQIYKESALYM